MSVSSVPYLRSLYTNISSHVIPNEGFALLDGTFLTNYRFKPAFAFLQWPDSPKAAAQKILLSTPQKFHRGFRVGKSLVSCPHFSFSERFIFDGVVVAGF